MDPIADLVQVLSRKLLKKISSFLDYLVALLRPEPVVAGALERAVEEHVAVADGHVVQHDQVEVHLVRPALVGGSQGELARVLHLGPQQLEGDNAALLGRVGMFDDRFGNDSLRRLDHLAVLCPGEGGGRLTLHLDLNKRTS